MKKQNSRCWQPMTLREVVGLFALPLKKPPDGAQILCKPDSGGKDR